MCVCTLSTGDSGDNDLCNYITKAQSTRIQRFLYPQIFLCGYEYICVHTYMTVHTYPIRVWTSQRISQQSSRGKRLILILWHQRIQKYTDTSVHTYPDTQRIQKFLLWWANTEISGYTERIRWTHVDAMCIRIKKICGYKNLWISVDGA